MNVRGRSTPALGFMRATPAVDLACGVVLTMLGILLATKPDGGGLIGALTIPAATLPLIWRRRAALGASLALSVGVVLSAVPTFDQSRSGVEIPAALLVLYALGRSADQRSARGGLVAILGAMVFLVFTDPNLTPDTVVSLLPLAVGLWGTGRLVAARSRVVAALRVRSAELEHQRAQTAQLAVQIERTRLTSELDGAVRANVDEMVRLAAQGERELSADPAAARDAFARIENAGRTSLDEMRELLGVLSSDEHAVREPRPTLGQLDRLLAEARAGGRVVDLAITGDRIALSGGVELAAYRIVEHALAALGAGRDRRVSVCLRFAHEVLEVEVEGARVRGTAVDNAPIIAAREQAAARGGSFDVTATGVDRTVLCARLPCAATYA